MTPLPIDSYLPEIVERLRGSRSLVIVAQPGAGKTTRVPPAILRGGLLNNEHPNLVMLQPRRVAARAAAQRIAQENGWEIGREVGYQIRFEKRIGPETRLRVLTEGILTRQLLNDPFLEGVGAVILDEFHERSLHVDLAAAMLREMRQTVRPDILLVIMSATLDAQPAAQFLGNCPVINVPGRTYPVQIDYRPRASVTIADRMAAAVQEVAARGEIEGDILAFLPGAEEIRRAMRQLEMTAKRDGLEILPLHGRLPAEEQTLALRPSDRRKVILATNIAETSLTIPGVRCVIDGGLAREPAFDPRRGLDRLELKRISKASAAQRAGRAGRAAPGWCVRLWSTKEQAALEDFATAEIHRVDLCGAILDIYAWGKADPNDFGWFEPPPPAAIASAKQLLEILGAIDSQGITAMGRRLVKLPVHPRLGRMLCAAADAGCAEEGAALAALLSERDVRRRHSDGPLTKGDSDLLVQMEDPSAMRQIAAAKAELARIARRLSAASAKRPSHEMLLKLPLWGYPDRVCRRRQGDSSAGVMCGGGGVRLAAESVVRDSEFFLALDARHDPRSPSREAIVRTASAIRPEWLFEMFPQSIRRRRTTAFDAKRQSVVGHGVVEYRDLVLREDFDAPVDVEEAGPALAAALRPRAVEIFAADESAAGLLARVAFLRRWMPEYSWSKFDDNELGDLLAELCAMKWSLEEVRRAGLGEALESRLAWPLPQVLKEQAPMAMDAPSGSRIRLTYAANQPAPVLAVRLQEIFGWRNTPRVAGGRVAVLLHLLGPNFQPVQITDDLESFWTTTYFQVRKDLRVRYPRHSWPDDPLTAKAQAKGGRKRQG